MAVVTGDAEVVVVNLLSLLNEATRSQQRSLVAPVQQKSDNIFFRFRTLEVDVHVCAVHGVR